MTHNFLLFLAQVDSHFCRNCLENIPSSEAKLRKNKCNSCFDCPSCDSVLSARATSIQVPMTSGSEAEQSQDANSSLASSGKMVTKKMYYLACLACRYTSRDVGISDQASQNFCWPEQEYKHANRFGKVLDYYQSVVLHDKQMKQEEKRRKTTKPTKFPSMTVSWKIFSLDLLMNIFSPLGSYWIKCFSY